MGELSSNSFKISVDLFPKISAVHVSISCLKSDLTRIVVNIHKNHLTFCVYSDTTDTYEIDLKSGFNLFIPTSYQNISGITGSLKQKENTDVVHAHYDILDLSSSSLVSISFRLQVHIGESTSALFLSSLSSKADIKTDTPYVIRCISCQAKLIDDNVTFTSIVQMPGNIDELSELFFCHKHEDRIYGEPKANELRHTLTDYKLSCLSENFIYKDAESLMFHCKNCHTSLSHKIMSELDSVDLIIPCFKDKIWFEDFDHTSPRPIIKDVALELLTDIIEDISKSSIICKLILEVQISPKMKKCLLIQVLDSNVKRYDFQQSLAGSVSDDISFQRVMKLFFKAAKSNEEECIRWRHVLSVEHYNISDTMFQEVLDVLNQNKLSNVASNMEGFSLSFLPVI